MNGFDNNVNLRSYQLRSNININLTKTTEAVVRLSGTFDDYRGPLDGGDVMYKKIVRSILYCFRLLPVGCTAYGEALAVW